MTIEYKPKGYSSVSPYLIVNGADKTINFLIKVFGATILRRIADVSGKVIHAEVRFELKTL